MRDIAIVGGGQCGLQLAHGLLQRGHRVTVITNRDAQSIRNGRVLSSQCMFHTALEHERALGLNLWDAQCPPVEGIEFNLVDDGRRAVHWAARLDHCAQSVDQRLKIPEWMQRFEAAGGELVIAEADVAMLDRLAAEHELVLVASGKGDIGRLFERDPERSAFDRPMRALALTYVHGLEPRPEHSAVCFNIIPGVGEYFVFPALTLSGPCEIMVFEGIVGGPMDVCWKEATTPAEHLRVSLELLERYLPWEAARARHVELTDDNGILAGRFPPTVRRPVATLPSGRQVMGVADVVALNDPLTGQGSNNASKFAHLMLAAIEEHGERPFDAVWMQQTFERYWDYARWVIQWTNALLLPPAEPIPTLLRRAAELPALASAIANGFDNPPDFAPWFFDPQAAAEKLRSLEQAA